MQNVYDLKSIWNIKYIRKVYDFNIKKYVYQEIKWHSENEQYIS